MLDQLAHWWQVPSIKAIALIFAAILAARIVELLFSRVILTVVKRTATTTDDEVAQALRRPVYFSVLFVGLALAARILALPPAAAYLVSATLKTLAILLWSGASLKIAALLFRALASTRPTGLFQQRTEPIFNICSKLVVVAAATYFVLLAWHINVGAWLASAGIAGLAVGFAAKDTLANLFAGIFILADAPYQVGDFIVLDGDLRGRVTAIGFRSTRLLTLDDIEITIPNGVLGNSQIVNESGGPYKKARVAVTVEAAYGSDAEQVREVLLSCAEGAPHVMQEPKPLVRFAAFGASGLEHKLLVWIERPSLREIVVDDLNRRVYKAFNDAGIEIPYSKHDVYLKQVEGRIAA